MSVPPFKGNIEKLTVKNKTYYRKVLHTNAQQQLVIMSLHPGQDIGMEVHPHTSQFIRVEAGSGAAIIGGQHFRLKDGDAVVIPPGTQHNIIAGAKGLKLYTLYSPPEHHPDTRQREKPEEGKAD
jgi:mannose-6-phosphate isomerase-like protein (cupin superfamily)